MSYNAFSKERRLNAEVLVSSYQDTQGPQCTRHAHLKLSVKGHSMRPKHSDSDTVAPAATLPFIPACFRPDEVDKKNMGQEHPRDSIVRGKPLGLRGASLREGQLRRRRRRRRRTGETLFLFLPRGDHLRRTPSTTINL